MGYRLGKQSIARLEGVHPFIVRVVEVAITRTAIDFTVLEGLRSRARQAKLVAAGASRTLDGKHLVQADGYGHAVDLVALVDGRPSWEWPLYHQIAAAVQDAVASVNEDRLAAGKDVRRLRWGGVWDRPFESLGRGPEAMKAAVNAYIDRRRALGRSAFIDGPHFELAA